jgi:hypothetical protein
VQLVLVIYELLIVRLKVSHLCLVYIMESKLV